MSRRCLSCYLCGSRKYGCDLAACSALPRLSLKPVFEEHSLLQVVQYVPVPCKACGAILNPHVRMDFNSQQWTCPFCHVRNHFPAHYRGITPEVMLSHCSPGTAVRVALSSNPRAASLCANTPQDRLRGMHVSSHTYSQYIWSHAPQSALWQLTGAGGAMRVNGLSLVLQHQPAELYGEYTTIEYQMAANNVMPPAYVFIVDTSVAEDELRACVASLSQALTTLPEYTQVSSAACFLCLLQRRARMRHTGRVQTPP